MIESVKLIKTPDHQFNYITEYSLNRQIQTLYRRLQEGITFKPGINVLIGKNGSGKSTVLNIIRAANRIQHSFIPQMDHLPITTLEDLYEIYNCFEIKQDYRYFTANLYRMSEDAKKLASNDLQNAREMKQYLSINEESKGQNVMGDIRQLWNQIFTHTEECYPILYYASELAKKFPEEEKEGLVKRPSGKMLLELMGKTSIEPEDMVITILMDEPDQGLDIDNLQDIYNIVSNQREDTQLICVVHNASIINKLSKLDYINFIEMTPGYLNNVKNFVEG